MNDWKPFPHADDAYDYAGSALEKHWPELHRGDRVPCPDAENLEAVLEACPDAAPAGFDGDFEALAERLRNAWRAFHRGDFGEAVAIGAECGPLGHAPANKAAGIYATYLETGDRARQAIFKEAADRAEAAAQALPDDPNTHYFQAFNLGRYSQSISIAKALRQGIGGKIRDCLDRALALEPDHAEAHTALGLYHAEIIAKIGKTVGRMTYGASADRALEHFQRAIELTPDAPIAHMEYANGLYLLFGDGRLDEVSELYVKASEMTPRDAMERLDVEAAAAELE